MDFLSVLFNQGLELLVYGMGTVVLFLTLLIFATRGMSSVVLRFFPEPVESSLHARKPRPSMQSDAEQRRRLVAATAAVRAHRRRHSYSSTRS